MKFYDALTDFIFTEQKPEKADAIFVPGGLYGEIAQHAAELYQQGFASLIVPSGKYSIVEGKFTEAQSPEKYKGRYFETESDFLTQILVDEGVKKSRYSAGKRSILYLSECIIYQGSSREKRAAFKKSDPVLSGISRQKMSDVLSVCFPGNRIYRLTGHYQGCFKRKLVSERVRYLSGTQRGGTLRQPVRRYDVRPCLCPINVGRDDKDCMKSVTEI